MLFFLAIVFFIIAGFMAMPYWITQTWMDDIYLSVGLPLTLAFFLLGVALMLGAPEQPPVRRRPF